MISRLENWAIFAFFRPHPGFLPLSQQAEIFNILDTANQNPVPRKDEFYNSCVHKFLLQYFAKLILGYHTYGQELWRLLTYNSGGWVVNFDSCCAVSYPHLVVHCEHRMSGLNQHGSP